MKVHAIVIWQELQKFNFMGNVQKVNVKARLKLTRVNVEKVKDLHINILWTRESKTELTAN